MTIPYNAKPFSNRTYIRDALKDKDIEIDKGIIFNQGYTLYSCRAFFINQRLEVGVAPMHVAKLVGHQIRTMEKHYENIQLLNLEPELVKVTRDNLEENDFQTFDIDML